MMLSRPIASGTMLVLLIGAGAAAVLQQGADAPEAGVAEISEPAQQTAQTEQAATAPDRVVESAGFPVVSQAERDLQGDEPSGPIVTVNGRPLGEAPEEAPSEVSPPEETIAEDVEPTEAEPVETEIAMVEPPLPRPRPQELAVREDTGLDYDAIAEAASTQQQAVPTPSGPQTLEPMPGASGFDPSGGYHPSQDELVGVVGPNGEVIWVYEDQVQSLGSRVTVQRQQPQPVNPFGFVFD